MKLGVILDVHANLPALEAVLSDMPNEVDEILCLGDVVGYNPFPRECVDLVQNTCTCVLQGNHDREVRNSETYSSNSQAEAGLRYAERELSEEQITYLLRRPEQIEVDGFLAVHSHPENVDEYVFPGDLSEIERYLDGFRGLFMGHTHLQYCEFLEGGIAVNPGSVGQPRDGTAAEYAVVDTEKVEADLYTASYDIQSVVEEINKSCLPNSTAERLVSNSQGRRRTGNPWR